MRNELKVTTKMIARWWLAMEDRRLAMDPNFLSFLHGYHEQKDLTTALGISARMSRAQLDATNLATRLNDGMEEIEVECKIDWLSKED